MNEHLHGGDIYSFERRFMKKPIDFSANINPLGLPDSVKQAYLDSVILCEDYPDYKCTELRNAIAEYEQVSADNIVCGNGAADLIFRIAYGLRPKNALLLSPSFSEYEKALNACGSVIRFHTLYERNGFILNDDIMDDIKGADIFIICNPDNPTGCEIDHALLLDIIKRCKSEDCVLIIDECFIELSDGIRSCVNYLAGNDNLIILKAFTKTYAMPGLRLGYSMTYNKSIIDAINNSAQSWSVSTVAQKCGVAAFGESDYLKSSKSIITIERAYLIAKLTKLGAKIYGSKANYIFFHIDIHDLAAKAEEHGFMIRDCSNYRGLGGGYYRIAVKLHDDNSALINMLQEVIGG